MKVGTFNIRHGAPAETYIGDAGEVAKACAALNVDVLALQEVDQGIRRSKGVDLAAVAAEASGMEVVFAETMPFRGGSYGNALLVRGEIENYEVLELRGGRRFWVRREPRNAILATTCIDDRRILVAATHLSTQGHASRKQLDKVVAGLANREKPEEPQVFLGDLNRKRHRVIGHLSINSMELADGDATFPSPNPRKSIDHIAVKGLAILSVEAIHFPRLSDHRALVAEVE